MQDYCKFEGSYEILSDQVLRLYYDDQPFDDTEPVYQPLIGIASYISNIRYHPRNNDETCKWYTF